MLAPEDYAYLDPILLAQPAAFQVQLELDEDRNDTYHRELLSLLDGAAEEYGFVHKRYEATTSKALVRPVNDTCPDQRLSMFPPLQFNARFLRYDIEQFDSDDPRLKLIGLCATFHAVRLLPGQDRLSYQHVLQVPVLGTYVRDAEDSPEVSLQDLQQLVVIDEEQPGSSDE